MCPYHNQMKQRIQNKELVSCDCVEKHKTIHPFLLLDFETYPQSSSIREYRFKEYDYLLMNLAK